VGGEHGEGDYRRYNQVTHTNETGSKAFYERIWGVIQIDMWRNCCSVFTRWRDSPKIASSTESGTLPKIISIKEPKGRKDVLQEQSSACQH